MPDDPRHHRAHTISVHDAFATPELDRLTRLAARLLQAPIALVSLVEADRVLIASSHGLPHPWAAAREIPISRAVCALTAEGGTRLPISDLRDDPRARESIAAIELGARAYAGVPFRAGARPPVGTIAVLDGRPRQWTEDELQSLEEVGALAAAVIGRRLAGDHDAAAVRDLVEYATDIIVSAAPDGRIVFANRAWRTTFGYTAEETARLRPVDMVAPEDKGRYVEAAKRMLSGETITDFEATLVAKDGRRIAVRGGGSCRFQDGLPVATRTIFRDISEEKRAEIELRVLQRVTHAISEAADLRGAYLVTLRELCRASGWPYAEVWVPSAEGDLLVHGPVWHEADARLAMLARGRDDLRFAPGVDLPGRAWASRQAVWLTDMSSEPEFVGAGLARIAGVRTGVAVPVLADDEVVAVLAFHALDVHPEDPHRVSLLAAVAAQVGGVVRRRRAEAALREAGRRFRSVLETTRFVAVTLDIDGRVTFANDAFLNLTGWKRGEVIGCDWFERFTPPTGLTVAYQKALRHGGLPRHFEQQILTRTGQRRLILWDNTPLRDGTGRECGVASLGDDITERKAAAEAQARLTAILELTPDVVAISTLDGSLQYVNRAGRRILGLAENEKVAAVNASDVQPQFARGGALEGAMRTAIREGVWRGETVLRKRDGREIPVEQIILTHRSSSGELEYISSIIRDIIERRQTEATLRGLALVDELTGLHNRRGFTTLAEQEWKRARREGWPVLVFYMDLDGFKTINDDFGHAEGDAVLKAVAGILKATFREADVVGRMGGDEFTVLAIHGDEKTETSVLARLEQRVADHNAASGKPYRIRFSTGVARATAATAESLTEVLARADVALYEAKRSNKRARAAAS